MKISVKGCYALQIMADLAINDKEGFVSLKSVMQRRQIESAKYLEQVVALLSKAGLLASMRGNNGGYKLTRHPSQYSIGEILRVTEGSLSPIDCLDKPSKNCVRSTG